VLLGTLSLPLVLPALATSLIATAVAWVALPSRPTYIVPTYSVHASQIAWALLVGPIAGLASVVYIRLITGAHALRPIGWLRVAAQIGVFTALGLVAIAYPEVLGNGKGVVQLALVGRLAVGVMAVLIVLKPLATAACLGSGAPGGLFTPTLCLGVVFGGVLGDAWIQIWPGAALGSYAVIGGAAILAASMQAPLAAVVLLLELTNHVNGLMVPMLLAVVEATVVSRLLRAHSIYSARLPAPRWMRTSRATGTSTRASQPTVPAFFPETYSRGKSQLRPPDASLPVCRRPLVFVRRSDGGSPRRLVQGE
jgi:chloride channel protein, CIC family